jgi:Domain of unknown function (DUF4145)
LEWHHIQNIAPRSYTCGHCGNRVGSNRGWHTAQFPPDKVSIYVCSVCLKPSLFVHGAQHPGVAPGQPVANVPDSVQCLYDEARSAVAANANTAAVLACRKLLMNVAVSQGAAPGLTFVAYVEHLAAAGFIPPNGRSWVDHIRRKGNEATHEIQLMQRSDAEELIVFSEMLLKFVYEFPARVPAP